MSNIKNGMRAAIAGFILASATLSPAFADDTEIYLSTAPSAAVRPNVLLIVDNSRSMDANDVTGERAEYNREHDVCDVRQLHRRPHLLQGEGRRAAGLHVD